MQSQAKSSQAVLSKPQGQVHSQISELRSSIDSLESSVSALSARTHLIVSGHGREESKAAPEPVLVPLADDIRSCVYRCLKINDDIQTILNGMEI